MAFYLFIKSFKAISAINPVEMRKKVSAIFTILFIIVLAAAVGGCTGSQPKIVVTVDPASLNAATDTPTAVPSVRPASVTVEGGTTTISGVKGKISTQISLDKGVYVVDWLNTGSTMTASLSDMTGNTFGIKPTLVSSGQTLLIVDGSSMLSGYATLTVNADSGWTIKLTKPDDTTASSLPQSLSGDETSEIISKPFHAGEGDIKISYTFSQVPSGDGSINIYDVSTGQPFYVRPLRAGSELGDTNAEVPSTGIYIAQVKLPAGASYGDLTISQ